MAVKAVLFDFDGTLVDTNELIVQSFQECFRTFCGVERDRSDIIKTFGEPLVATLENFFPGRGEEALTVYHEYQIARYKEHVHVCDGMEELLRELTARGYRLAVVTTRRKASAYEYMEHCGLTGYFEAVVTIADTEKHKPDPEPALAALAKLGLGPEAAVMIGDTKFDIGCANNAGITSVLVNWSVAAASYDESTTFRPDYVIEDPAELFSVIAELDAAGSDR